MSAWTGRIDGLIEPVEHDNIEDAVDWIESRQEIDPEGYEHGVYFADSEQPVDGKPAPLA